MKVGNVTHAIGLSVIGIGAIAALVVQVAARLNRPVASHAATKQQIALGAAEVPDGLPTTVYGDPFAHPKLVKPAGFKPPAPSQESVKPGPVPPLGLKGELGFEPALPDVGAVKTGGDEKIEIQKIPHTLYLQAIVGATEWVAFVAVDDGKPLELRKGSTVVPGITISEIMEGTIVLRLGGEKRTIRVGERVEVHEVKEER